MIFVGLGILLGGLVGLLAVTIAGISITLTTSGGALVMGLIFRWLRSKTPKFGRIPEPALWIFDNVGLAAFIGIVGLSAGPSFVSGLSQTGIGLLFAGIIVAIVPHIVGFLVGTIVKNESCYPAWCTIRCWNDNCRIKSNTGCRRK